MYDHYFSLNLFQISIIFQLDGIYIYSLTTKLPDDCDNDSLPIRMGPSPNSEETGEFVNRGDLILVSMIVSSKEEDIPLVYLKLTNNTGWVCTSNDYGNICITKKIDL